MSPSPNPSPVLIQLVGDSQSGFDPGLAAVIAACVSLFLGLAGLVSSHLAAKQAVKRAETQRRADAYVELLKVVERRGLAVQDQMYNWTETEDEDSPEALPHRTIDVPPRSDRTEALALVAAYGTTEIRKALTEWLKVVDRWEAKRDGFEYDYRMSGPFVLTREQAEPEGREEGIGDN